MAATRAFNVVRVNRAAVDHAQGVLDREPLVEAVGVETHLNVVGIGYPQRHIERRRMGTDVLMDLEARRTRREHALEGLGAAGRPTRQHQRIERRLVECGMNVLQGPGRVGAEVPDRTVVLDHERREAGRQGLIGDARAEQMNVGVDRACGGNQPLTRNDRGVGSEHHIDAVHDVGIACTPNRDDPSIGDADGGLAHAEDRINHQYLRDRNLDGIERRLRHQAVPSGLGEPAEHFVAALLIVGLDLDDEARVAEAHAIPDRRPVDARVGLRIQAHASAPR